MEKDILSFAVEKTHELIGAPTCSSETKAAAEAWLNAVGTEQEAEETKKYIDELGRSCAFWSRYRCQYCSSCKGNQSCRSEVL